jgi:tRNA A-37 threonylcarbamoyl transferase component Bud32
MPGKLSIRFSWASNFSFRHKKFPDLSIYDNKRRCITTANSSSSTNRGVLSRELRHCFVLLVVLLQLFPFSVFAMPQRERRADAEIAYILPKLFESCKPPLERSLFELNVRTIAYSDDNKDRLMNFLRPVGRIGFVVTASENMVFVGGGWDGTSTFYDIVHSYDKRLGRWKTATLSEARAFLAAASLGNRILFGGGLHSNGYSNVVDIYDTLKGVWSTATLTQPRAFLAATSLGNLAFFGGGRTHGDQPSNVVDIFDATRQSWRTTTLSQARWNLSACSIDDLIIFSGGCDSSGLSFIVDIYNVTSDMWLTVSKTQSLDSSASVLSTNTIFSSRHNDRKRALHNVADIMQSPSSAPSGTPSSSLDSGTVAAIVIGILAAFIVLAVVIIVIWFFLKKRREQEKKNITSPPQDTKSFTSVGNKNSLYSPTTTASNSKLPKANLPGPGNKESESDYSPLQVGHNYPLSNRAQPTPVSTGENQLFLNPQGNQPVLGTQNNQPTFGTQNNQPILGAQGNQPVLGTQSNQPTFSTQSNQPVLGTQSNQPTFSTQSNQPVLGAQSNQPTFSTQSNQPVLGAQSNQPVLGAQSNQPVLGAQDNRQLENKFTFGSGSGSAQTPGQNQFLFPNIFQQLGIQPPQERQKSAQGDKDHYATILRLFKEVEDLKEIGVGNYGKVYKGIWQKQPVAVKIGRTKILDKVDVNVLRNDLQNEANILSSLPPHPNVVKFFKAMVEESHTAIVLEYCGGGSLDKVLANKDRIITLEQMMKWIRGIAAGMLHLHKHNVIHRDLAARNILLDNNDVPKISDFGMSRVLDLGPEGRTRCPLGPVCWMAPESLRKDNKVYSQKSDVWMFGIVVYEIIARQEPHAGQNPVEVAKQIRDNGLTPQIPSNCPSNLRQLMLSCWNKQPELRPSFEDICRMLQ